MSKKHFTMGLESPLSNAIKSLFYLLVAITVIETSHHIVDAGGMRESGKGGFLGWIVNNVAPFIAKIDIHECVGAIVESIIIVLVALAIRSGFNRLVGHGASVSPSRSFNTTYLVVAIATSVILIVVSAINSDAGVLGVLSLITMLVFTIFNIVMGAMICSNYRGSIITLGKALICWGVYYIIYILILFVTFLYMLDNDSSYIEMTFIPFLEIVSGIIDCVILFYIIKPLGWRLTLPQNDTIDETDAEENTNEPFYKTTWGIILICIVAVGIGVGIAALTDNKGRTSFEYTGEDDEYTYEDGTAVLADDATTNIDYSVSSSFSGTNSANEKLQLTLWGKDDVEGTLTVNGDVDFKVVGTGTEDSMNLVVADFDNNVIAEMEGSLEFYREIIYSGMLTVYGDQAYTFEMTGW